MHHTFALAPYLSISAAHFLREGLFGVRLDEDSTVLRWRVDMCGAGMRAWRGMDCMVWNVVSYVLGRPVAYMRGMTLIRAGGGVDSGDGMGWDGIMDWAV
jgi:hypothetical protein